MFEHSRLWADWRREGVTDQTDRLQSGLYDFIGCLTIKGLSPLDMTQCQLLCRVWWSDHDPWISWDRDEPYSTNDCLNLTRHVRRSLSKCVVRRGNNSTLDDCTLAPLPFVGGGQTMTFGLRQMEDNSYWRLNLCISPAVVRSRWGWRLKAKYLLLLPSGLWYCWPFESCSDLGPLRAHSAVS